MSPASALAHLPCCHPAQCWVGPKDSVTMRPHPASGAWMCFPILEDILGLRNYLEKPEQETARPLFPLRKHAGTCVQKHQGIPDSDAKETFHSVRAQIPHKCGKFNIIGIFKCWRPMRSRAMCCLQSNTRMHL